MFLVPQLGRGKEGGGLSRCHHDVPVKKVPFFKGGGSKRSTVSLHIFCAVGNAGQVEIRLQNNSPMIYCSMLELL